MPKRIFKLKYSEFESEIKKNLNKQSISALKNNKAKQLYKFLTFIKNYENKSNIIEFSPELSALNAKIQRTRNEVASLEEQQQQIENYTNQIKRMITWK